MAKKTTTKKKATGSVKDAARATTAATAPKGGAKAGTKAKAKANATRAKDAKRGGQKRVGILGAAVVILAKAGGPMGCRAIVEQAIESGVWKTSGKTPEATLYAAIIREIKAKGKDARFKKVDRGLFEAR